MHTRSVAVTSVHRLLAASSPHFVEPHNKSAAGIKKSLRKPISGSSTGSVPHDTLQTRMNPRVGALRPQSSLVAHSPWGTSPTEFIRTRHTVYRLRAHPRPHHDPLTPFASGHFAHSHWALRPQKSLGPLSSIGEFMYTRACVRPMHIGALRPQNSLSNPGTSRA